MEGKTMGRKNKTEGNIKGRKGKVGEKQI